MFGGSQSVVSHLAGYHCSLSNRNVSPSPIDASPQMGQEHFFALCLNHQHLGPRHCQLLLNSHHACHLSLLHSAQSLTPAVKALRGSHHSPIIPKVVSQPPRLCVAQPGLDPQRSIHTRSLLPPLPQGNSLMFLPWLGPPAWCCICPVLPHLPTPTLRGSSPPELKCHPSGRASMTPIIPNPPSYFFHSNSRHLGVKHLLAYLVWFVGTRAPFVNQERAYKALSISPAHSRAWEMQDPHLNNRESEMDLESSGQRQESKAGCWGQSREVAGKDGSCAQVPGGG